MRAFKCVKLNRKEMENRKASEQGGAVAAEQNCTLVSQISVSRVCPETGVRTVGSCRARLHAGLSDPCVRGVPETGLNWNLSYNPQKWTLRKLSSGHNMLSNLHVSFRHSCKRSPPQETYKVPAFFCSECGGWRPCGGG